MKNGLPISLQKLLAPQETELSQIKPPFGSSKNTCRFFSDYWTRNDIYFLGWAALRLMLIFVNLWNVYRHTDCYVEEFSLQKQLNNINLAASVNYRHA